MRILIALVAALASLHAASSPAQGPSATVAEERYDFGSVMQGAHLNHAFALRNSGDAPLRITGADLSLPGMKIRLAPAEIPAGGEGTVTIDWSTDHVAGTVEGVARIHSNDPARPQITLTLAGSVTPALSIEPIPAVFLSTYANEPAERVLTVRNNAGHALTLTRVDPGPHVTATLATVESGKVFSVAVRAAPHTPVGKYEESLALVTDDAAVGQLTIPVHLWIKSDLYANPDAIDFGTVSRSAAKEPAALIQTAMIKRRTGTFEIKSIASDVPAVTAVQSPAGPSGSFTISLRLRPETLAPGAKIAGKIRVATSDPEYPEVVIPVSGAVAASPEAGH